MRRDRITITIRRDVLERLDAIIDGDKIRNRSNAIETIVLRELKSQPLNKAVILAGDSAIRLNDSQVLKPLLPLGDETLIEKNITHLKKSGVKELILAVGKSSDQLKKLLGNGADLGIKIHYVRSTAGSAEILQKAKTKLNSTFLMTNGDILLETIDLEDMYRFHKKNQAAATVAVATSPDPSRLGSIFVKGNMINNFREKATDESEQSNLINGGVYLFEPKVTEQLRPTEVSLEKNLFPRLAKAGKLSAYQIGKNWIHLHDLERYQEYLDITTG
jgi:NDP-sugar pyrophosphorylase family protein